MVLSSTVVTVVGAEQHSSHRVILLSGTVVTVDGAEQHSSYRGWC